MSLFQQGIMNIGGNLDEEIQKTIDEIFSALDSKISSLSQARGLHHSQVRALQPLHACVVVDENDVFVVLAVHDIGGISKLQFVDWSGKPTKMTIETAIFLAERDLSFRDAFGFQFLRSVLEMDSDEMDKETDQIAKLIVDNETIP